ncbi:ricin-type beta-trefoil lectin domain protein [Leptospira inadai serovar Lyme str. 10]|uniref:Ricin-type beta-trefoil lectin domain protein n=2 Tax=Leptospira inadai serovar Lyme TaxID=293084 RepID=V6HEY4_9LEPT|nr:ricin-type beta-trefoil lectin domain protein [Leptospira inadai]EQA38013.1 ricin-type beta-trefoil lectin domain protein [Leptospira inadai serovar Lyme str. 10]PNV75147.1 hypothetical protein BES34_009630 [Leptospira inadai serovar Lyme]
MNRISWNKTKSVFAVFVLSLIFNGCTRGLNNGFSSLAELLGISFLGKSYQYKNTESDLVTLPAGFGQNGPQGYLLINSLQNVDRYKDLMVIFSESMQQTSTNQNISLTYGTQKTPLPGPSSANGGPSGVELNWTSGTTLVINPLRTLLPNQTYTLTISSGALTTRGKALQAYSVSFTTEGSFDMKHSVLQGNASYALHGENDITLDPSADLYLNSKFVTAASGVSSIVLNRSGTSANYPICGGAATASCSDSLVSLNSLNLSQSNLPPSTGGNTYFYTITASSGKTYTQFFSFNYGALANADGSVQNVGGGILDQSQVLPLFAKLVQKYTQNAFRVKDANGNLLTFQDMLKGLPQLRKKKFYSDGQWNIGEACMRPGDAASGQTFNLDYFKNLEYISFFGSKPGSEGKGYCWLPTATSTTYPTSVPPTDSGGRTYKDWYDYGRYYTQAAHWTFKDPKAPAKGSGAVTTSCPSQLPDGWYDCTSCRNEYTASSCAGGTCSRGGTYTQTYCTGHKYVEYTAFTENPRNFNKYSAKIDAGSFVGYQQATYNPDVSCSPGRTTCISLDHYVTLDVYVTDIKVPGYVWDGSGTVKQVVATANLNTTQSSGSDSPGLALDLESRYVEVDLFITTRLENCLGLEFCYVPTGTLLFYNATARLNWVNGQYVGSEIQLQDATPRQFLSQSDFKTDSYGNISLSPRSSGFQTSDWSDHLTISDITYNGSNNSVLDQFLVWLLKIVAPSLMDNAANTAVQQVKAAVTSDMLRDVNRRVLPSVMNNSIISGFRDQGITMTLPDYLPPPLQNFPMTIRLNLSDDASVKNDGTNKGIASSLDIGITSNYTDPNGKGLRQQQGKTGMISTKDPSASFKQTYQFSQSSNNPGFLLSLHSDTITQAAFQLWQRRGLDVTVDQNFINTMQSITGSGDPLYQFVTNISRVSNLLSVIAPDRTVSTLNGVDSSGNPLPGVASYDTVSFVLQPLLAPSLQFQPMTSAGVPSLLLSLPEMQIVLVAKKPASCSGLTGDELNRCNSDSRPNGSQNNLGAVRISLKAGIRFTFKTFSNPLNNPAYANLNALQGLISDPNSAVYTVEVLGGDTYNPYSLDPEALQEVMTPLVQTMIIPFINSVLKEIPLPPTVTFPKLRNSLQDLGCSLKSGSDSIQLFQLDTPQTDTPYYFGGIRLVGNAAQDPSSLLSQCSDSGTGYIYLQNKKSGYYLHVDGDGTMSNGKPLVQWYKNGGGNQLWWYDPETKRLHVKTDPNYCLDNRGNLNGGRLVVWQCNTGPNQQFLIGDGYIRNVSDTNSMLRVIASPSNWADGLSPGNPVFNTGWSYAETLKWSMINE